ncbi:uncharacterized protein LOC144436210 [Glandiceps talaboti]
MADRTDHSNVGHYRRYVSPEPERRSYKRHLTTTSTTNPVSSSSIERCDCCPYGYHIDLDFIEFCDDIKSGANLAKLRSFRRSRTRTRRTQSPSPNAKSSIPPAVPVRSSSLPGIGRSRLYSSDSESDIYPGTDDETFALAYSHFANQLQKFNHQRYDDDVRPGRRDYNYQQDLDLSSDTQSLPAFPFDDGLSDVDSESRFSVDNFLHNRKQSLPNVPLSSLPALFGSTSSTAAASSTTTVSPLSLSLSHTQSGSTSSLSSSSSSQFSPIHSLYASNGITSQQIASNLGSFLRPSRHASSSDSPTQSRSSTPSSHLSQSGLSHIRDQMALSLHRMKELEEQVKAIPVLQVKINVLKEEKRLLTMQLKARKNKQCSVGVGDSDINSTHGDLKSNGAFMFEKSKFVNATSPVYKGATSQPEYKTTSTQADIIVSDRKKDSRTIGAQANTNSQVHENELIHRHYQSSLTTERIMLSNSPSPTRDLKFLNRRQFNSPGSAKEVGGDQGVGFANVNSVECEKCKTKESRTIGVGEASVREKPPIKKRMVSIGVGSATLEEKPQIAVGTNTKPKVWRDKAVDMSLTMVTQSTNTPPPVRKSKAVLTDKTEMRDACLNTDMVSSDMIKKPTVEIGINTDVVKTVNTEASVKKTIDIRQIRRPPRPVRHIGINTMDTEESTTVIEKKFRDFGSGAGLVVEMIDSGNSPEPVLTSAKSMNTVPLVQKSIATATVQNLRDVSCNTVHKAVRDKQVSASLSKPSADKGVETGWVRMSIGTNTPHTTTQDTGCNHDSDTTDAAMMTDNLGSHVSTNTVVKETSEQGNNTVTKEYMDVATGEDNVCLSPVEESNEVEKVIIEPDIVAVDAGLVQQTPDSVLPRKEFCDVAVGEGKICDIVCDTCHNKKLKTVAVGVCSVKDTICDRCTNMKSRTIGVGNCTLTDTLCPSCKGGGVVIPKPSKTVGSGSCSVHDILCYKCAMMDCANKAVGDRKITDPMCNMCDKIPRRHIGVGIGTVNDILCDKCQMFNFVTQAVGDCTVDDRFCDRCDNLVTVDAAVDSAVCINQYQTVATGDNDVRRFDTSTGTDAVTMTSVAMETERLAVTDMGIGDSDVNTKTASVATELDTRTIAMETDQVAMATTATGTETISLRTVGSGTAPIIHISSGVGDSDVHTIDVGVGCEKSQTNSIGTATDKVTLTDTSTDAHTVPVTNTAMETDRIKTMDAGVGGNAVQSATAGTATNIITTVSIGVGRKPVDLISAGTVTDRIATTHIGIGGGPVHTASTGTVTDSKQTSTVGVGSDEIRTKTVATSASVPTKTMSVETNSIVHSSVGVGSQDITTKSVYVETDKITATSVSVNHTVPTQHASINIVRPPVQITASREPVTNTTMITSRSLNNQPVSEDQVTATAQVTENNHHQNNHKDIARTSGNGTTKLTTFEMIRTERSEKRETSYEPISGDNFPNKNNDVIDGGFANRHAVMSGSIPTQSDSVLRSSIKTRLGNKNVNKKEITFVGVNGNLGDVESSSSSSSSSSSESDSDDSSDSDTSEEGSYDGRLGKVVKVCETEGKVASVSELAAHGKDDPKANNTTAKDIKKIPEIVQIEESFELSDEMSKALAVLEKHMEKPGDSDTRDLAVCMSTIAQEWFRVSSQKEANESMVKDYVRAIHDMSKGILEKVVNLADGNGNTALHYCVSHGNFSIVDLLLATGVCDPNKQNKAGYTPIMLASLAVLKSEQQKTVIQKLFTVGNVNIRATQAGQTALMLAVSHGRQDMVKLLMEAKADVNMQDEDGSTALMCASEHGHLEIVKLLLSQPDCNPNLFDNDGSSALAIAMEAGHRDIGVLLYAQMNFSKNSSPGMSRARIKGSPSPTRRIPGSLPAAGRMSPSLGRKTPPPRNSPLPSPSNIPTSSTPRRNSTGSTGHSYTYIKERQEKQQQQQPKRTATTPTMARRAVAQRPARPGSAGSHTNRTVRSTNLKGK